MSLSKYLGNLFFGYSTKRVQNFLKNHGNEKIKSLVVGRVPLSGALNATVNAASLGKFEEAKKKQGYDKLYHLFLIINGKYKLEKNQNLNITEYSKSDNEENESVSAPNKTIQEFIDAGVKKLGEADFFTNYSAFKQNCQWLLKNLLNANGISSADKFIYQDVSKIREDVGESTEHVANQTTDLVSGIDKLVSWLSDGHYGFKHGGKVRLTHKQKYKRYIR